MAEESFMLIKYFFLALFCFLSSAYLPAHGAEACDDNGQIYRVCSDQQEIFSAAVDKAMKEKKMLLLVFGAEWCPWCKSLNTMLTTDELKKTIAKDMVVAEIGLYKNSDRLPSGDAVLKKIASLSKNKVKKDGIPVMAVYDPEKKGAFFIDTEPLEKNTKVSKGHDPKKLAAAVKKASSTLR